MCVVFTKIQHMKNQENNKTNCIHFQNTVGTIYEMKIEFGYNTLNEFVFLSPVSAGAIGSIVK